MADEKGMSDERRKSAGATGTPAYSELDFEERRQQPPEAQPLCEYPGCGKERDNSIHAIQFVSGGGHHFTYTRPAFHAEEEPAEAQPEQVCAKCRLPESFSVHRPPTGQWHIYRPAGPPAAPREAVATYGPDGVGNATGANAAPDSGPPAQPTSAREWSIEDGFNGAERVPFLVRSDGGDGIRLDAIAAQWLKETMFTAKKAEAAEALEGFRDVK